MGDRHDRNRRQADQGFTLIEVLLVVVMIAIITAAVAATVTVTLRHTPPTEVRADDARSMQGLVTWIPEDVDATPPSGFNRDWNYWPCNGTAPVSPSYNILTAEWEERTASTTKYAASYRYEPTDTGWAMRRYVCDDNATGTMGDATRINLTSALPDWDSANPPAQVVMCTDNVGADGACPAAAIIPASVTAPDEDVNGFLVESLKLVVTRADGGQVTIDAAPKNPDQDLSDDPSASTNNPPTRSGAENYVVQMYAGDTATLDLATTHGVSDPDGDPISVAIDSTESIPTGLTVVTSDPLNVEITADAGLAPGIVSDALADRTVFIVSDNRAGWIDVTVQVEILPQPNVPPSLTTNTYNLQLEQSTSIVLPLDVIFGVTDGNGDPVTVSVINHPPTPLAGAPGPNSPDPLDLAVTASGAAVGPYPIPITLLFDDGAGGTATAEIYVELVAPFVNTPPTATATNIAVDMYADDSLSLELDTSHGVSDPDGDTISITSITDPTGVTTTIDADIDVTIDTAVGLAEGTLAPVELTVSDVHGDSVTVTVTITIIPTPEPPSDCALQSLVVAPGVVDRQGNGNQPHLLSEDVTITATYTGSCDGLALNYDTGDTSGLGTNRVFPPGSPTSIIVLGNGAGGTEKWTEGFHTITLSTTSDVALTSLSVDLEVT